MFTLRTITLLSLSYMALVACNTFDPQLGEQPFRCGTDAPRCPDSYECVRYTSSYEVCESVRGTSSADGGNTSVANCDRDSDLEPNDTPAEATFSGIPTKLSTSFLPQICPAQDVDVFLFTIETTNTDVVVEIEFQSDSGLLELEVLNTAAVLGTGRPVSGNAGLLEVAIPNVAKGSYYARVKGVENAQNDYVLRITTSQ